MLSISLLSYAYFANIVVYLFILIVFISSFLKFFCQVSSTNLPQPQLYAIIMYLLSFCGVPPLLGFCPKVLVLSFAALTQSIYLFAALVLINFLFFYFYIQICKYFVDAQSKDDIGAVPQKGLLYKTYVGLVGSFINIFGFFFYAALLICLISLSF